MGDMRNYRQDNNRTGPTNLFRLFQTPNPNQHVKKIILSKISVHFEQKPKNAIFFDPNNSNNLSRILTNVFNEKKSKNRNNSLKRTKRNLTFEIEKYEKKYIDMIN